MTVVTKSHFARPEGRQDAKIFNSSGSWKWTLMNANIPFIVGENYVARFWLDVPQGATITLAQFVFEYTQKDGAPAQTANMALFFEQADNSAPWPYVEDTVIGGQPPISPRLLYTGPTFVISYPGGSTPGADIVTQTITSQIQTIVNRAGWEAGNYITLLMGCSAEGASSDMAIVAQPQIKVTYTYDDEIVARTDVNALINQTFANADDVINNSMFGVTMDNTTYATNPTGGRDGGPCLQVTAHPPAGQENRYCAAVMPNDGMGGETYVLSGWFYNPNVPDFTVDLVFLGGRVNYPQKNRWTPFASLPQTIAAGGGPLWCTFAIFGSVTPVTEGMWFLLDDLCLTRTSVMEMPWTGATPDKYNADYEPKETTAHGVSVRRSRARTHVILSGVSRARRHYVRNDQDMWVRAEPQRTGTWDNFGASTWDSVAAGVTWDTLE